MRRAPTGRAVAARVLRTAVHAAVLVVMTEVERLAGTYAFPAAPATNFAPSDRIDPSRSFASVRASVPALGRAAAGSLELALMISAAGSRSDPGTTADSADAHPLARHAQLISAVETRETVAAGEPSQQAKAVPDVVMTHPPSGQGQRSGCAGAVVHG